MAEPGQPVGVVSQTPQQQKRSALYTAMITVSIGVLTLATGLTMSKDMVKVLFPHQAEQINALAGIIVAIGGAAGVSGGIGLFTQRLNNADNIHEVDRSPSPGVTDEDKIDEH